MYACVYFFLFGRTPSLTLGKPSRFNRFDPRKRITRASRTDFNPRSRAASPLPSLPHIPSESYRGATWCERGNAIDTEGERERRGREIERDRAIRTSKRDSRQCNVPLRERGLKTLNPKYSTVEKFR